MGLIDDIRKRRDSWTIRFEEHRGYENGRDDHKDKNEDIEEAEILRNRKMVGVFPKEDKSK